MKPSPKAQARRRAHRDAMVELRYECFARDHYQCQAVGLLDGRCDGALAAHHRWIGQRFDAIENLVTLCHAHHQGTNGVHLNPTRAYAAGLLLHVRPGPGEGWVARDPSGSATNPRFGLSGVERDALSRWWWETGPGNRWE